MSQNAFLGSDIQLRCSNVLKFSDFKQFLMTCEADPAKVIPNPFVFVEDVIPCSRESAFISDEDLAPLPNRGCVSTFCPDEKSILS